jgi:hypothetical protein
MAFKLIESKDGYICDSSDTIPNAVEGATLHIVDTGEELIFHDGIWMPDLRKIYALKQVS